MSAKTARATKTEANVVCPSHLEGSTLPPDWEWISLGNVCKTTSGGTPSRKNKEYFEGDIPWVKSGELPDGPVSEIEEYITGEAVKNSSAKQFPKGTLLIALYGATVGKLGVLTQEAATNQAVCAIFPPDDLETKYLFWYLRFVRSDLIAQAIGGAQPNISQGILRNLMIPVAPPSQQKRIVAEIEKQFSRLDEAVANLKRVKANLKRYKASVLKAAVEGKLTEDWRKQHPDVEPASKLLERILAERRTNLEKYELAKIKSKGVSPRNETWKKRYKEVEPPKSDEAYAIPQGWVWVNLGQLSWSVKDGPHYSPKYSERGIPFISGGNIRPEGIDFSTAKFISPELHEELSERCKPEYGDLLYTKGGTTGIARINTERKEFSVWVHVAVLKLVDSINRLYLQHALNSPHCYRQSQKYTHGVGNQDLGLTRMIWITVPLPSLAEQEQIVTEVERRLSIIDELESAVEANLTRADRLRQSILKRAFEGKLMAANQPQRSDSLSKPPLAAESYSPYGVT